MNEYITRVGTYYNNMSLLKVSLCIGQVYIHTLVNIVIWNY